MFSDRLTLGLPPGARCETDIPLRSHQIGNCGLAQIETEAGGCAEPRCGAMRNTASELLLDRETHRKSLAFAGTVIKQNEKKNVRDTCPTWLSRCGQPSFHGQNDIPLRKSD